MNKLVKKGKRNTIAIIRLKTKTYILCEKGYSINQVSLILVRRGIKEPGLLSQASES